MSEFCQNVSEFVWKLLPQNGKKSFWEEEEGREKEEDGKDKEERREKQIEKREGR